MLEKFLFDPSMQYSPIGKALRRRKKGGFICSRCSSRLPTYFFLDEPTNDLDIETLAILEDFLDVFSGAVVTVSHDRYFLDKVVDRIFAF